MLRQDVEEHWDDLR
jgi:hypothetical protein